MASKTEAEHLTPQDVSDRLSGHVSVQTLSNWRREGTGPEFLKLGGKVLYPKEGFESWLEKQAHHPKAG